MGRCEGGGWGFVVKVVGEFAIFWVLDEVNLLRGVGMGEEDIPTMTNIIGPGCGLFTQCTN